MVRSIIISGKDLVESSAPWNDTYKYTFPTGMVRFKDCEIAVSSVSIWFSWYNISEELNNNTFTYTWNAEPVSGPYTITIPDGSYTVAELNEYVQYQMKLNGHYAKDGYNYRYFIEFVWNPTKYKIQLNSYPINTGPSGSWTLPTFVGTQVAWDWPADPTQCPQVTLTRDATNRVGFGYLTGFDTGTYPDTVTPTIVPPKECYSVLAQSVDEMEPISSVVLGTSLLQNTLAVPTTTLFSFPITDHGYGERTAQAGQLVFCPITDGLYTEFFIRFYDQDGNRFKMLDPDITVFLVIRQKSELLAIKK